MVIVVILRGRKVSDFLAGGWKGSGRELQVSQTFMIQILGTVFFFGCFVYYHFRGETANLDYNEFLTRTVDTL